MRVSTWDECFMEMAVAISKRSKDPSTRVGAIIVTSSNIVVGAGYNGFPRGLDDLPWSRDGSLYDTKYAYICHAEENAVYNSNGSTKGCKIYCTLFPCNECAKTLIQSGISEVIYREDKYPDSDEVRASKRMLDMAGVRVRKFK